MNKLPTSPRIRALLTMMNDARDECTVAIDYYADARANLIKAVAEEYPGKSVTISDDGAVTLIYEDQN